MGETVSYVTGFFKTGGVVMWPLMGVSVLLWYFVGLRIFCLRRGVGVNAAESFRMLMEKPDELCNSCKRGVLAAVLCEIGCRMKKNSMIAMGEVREVLSAGRLLTYSHARAIKTLVALATLLGLLGTVHGMIETFRSLQHMELFADSGGVAGGISEALVTTQMGLGLAIPGLLAALILERRARALRLELDEMESVAAGTTAQSDDDQGADG